MIHVPVLFHDSVYTSLCRYHDSSGTAAKTKH